MSSPKVMGIVNVTPDSFYTSSRVGDEAALRCRVVQMRAEGADMIDISGGMCRYTRVGHAEAGYFHETSGAVKKAVSIPVVLTGGIKSIEDAEQFLASGEADLIGVGRELLKDPHWADRAMSA